MRTLLNNPVALTLIIVSIVLVIVIAVAIVLMVKRHNLPENVHKRKVAQMEKEEKQKQENIKNNIAQTVTEAPKKETDPDAVKVPRKRKTTKVNSVIGTVRKK